MFAGIRIFTVGIGEKVTLELANIASVPLAEYFFPSQTFESTIGPFYKIAVTFSCSCE